MIILRPLVLLLSLLSGTAVAASPVADCSLARDPERCVVHQTALAACADQRGKDKSACLAIHIPPIDCSKADDPARCAATERAKQACADKSGKALKGCLKQKKPKRAKNKTKKHTQTSSANSQTR